MLISGIFCPLSLTLFHPHPLLLPRSHIKKVALLKQNKTKLGLWNFKSFPLSILKWEMVLFPPRFCFRNLKCTITNCTISWRVVCYGLIFWEGVIGVKNILGKRKTLLSSSWNYGGDQGLLWKAASTVRFFWQSTVNAPPCGVDISSFLASLYRTCVWF